MAETSHGGNFLLRWWWFGFATAENLGWSFVFPPAKRNRKRKEVGNFCGCRFASRPALARGNSTNKNNVNPKMHWRGVTLFFYCAVYQLRRKSISVLSVSFVWLLAVFGVCLLRKTAKASEVLGIVADCSAPHTPKTAVKDTQRKSKKTVVSSKKRKKARKIALFLLKTICCGAFF